MKKFLASVLTAAMALSLAVIAPAAPAFAAESGTETQQETSSGQTDQISLNYKDLIASPGQKFTLKLNGVKKGSKVKYKTTKKSVASVSQKGKVKIKKTGTVYIKAVYKKKTYKCRIRVYSKKKAANVYAKTMAKYIKKNCKKDSDRLLAASYAVMSGFQYGNHYTAEDLFYYGSGTCVAGSKMVAKILNYMVYKAKCRFAAKDKMSRYPQGIMFGSDHHNVQVKVKGKTYYVDGNPGMPMVYLTTSKKPIYYEIGGWGVITDERNGF